MCKNQSYHINRKVLKPKAGSVDQLLSVRCTHLSLPEGLLYSHKAGGTSSKVSWTSVNTLLMNIYCSHLSLKRGGVPFRMLSSLIKYKYLYNNDTIQVFLCPWYNVTFLYMQNWCKAFSLVLIHIKLSAHLWYWYVWDRRYTLFRHHFIL